MTLWFSHLNSSLGQIRVECGVIRLPGDKRSLISLSSTSVSLAQKTAADGKRQEIIVLDSKRSNAINIGLTVLPPPRTIKTAILNFDEYALNKEGIEVSRAGLQLAASGRLTGV